MITEDDIYRASTQYRLWSFTPESLASLRETTNKTASDRVVAAIQRWREKATSQPTNGESSSLSSPPADSTAVDCLTPAEELKLVEYYATQCLRAGDALFKFPTPVRATAVQYLKRFYLSNSPMTYHPKQLMPTCLFLATKTENNYIALSSFAAKFPKTTPEDVVAPEFILTQGLRFTFDVRHPHRGLRGGLMELLAIADGAAPASPSGMTPTQQQAEMRALPPPDASRGAAPPSLHDRCGAAHDRAKGLLAHAALLSDAYLLYTPAQIWLAALALADEPLALWYLGTKFGADEAAQARKTAVLGRVCECAALLEEWGAARDDGDDDEAKRRRKDELVAIDKKLYQCQNPEKRDLVGLNRAQKRDELDSGGEEGKAAKKRRLEREKLERQGEELFGGDIGGKKDGVGE